MRSITRQCVRLASHRRAVSCGCVGPSTVSRTPRLGYARAFHCSIHRSSESRLPNEHNAWLEKQREEQKHAGIDANKTDQAGEAENGATKSSADSRKGGTRRRTRERRIIELPPPPPIPDWFLRYNVTLVKDVVQEEDTNQGEAQVIRCVDANTGHTLFTVPYLAMVPKREREPASSVSGGTRMLTNVLGKLVDVTVLGIESRLLHSAPESLRLRLVAWELAKKRLQKPSDVSLKALDELFDSLPPSVQDYVLKLEKAEDKFSESARANYSGEFVAGESPQAAVQQPELLDTRACIDGTDGRINLHSRGSQSSTFSDEKFFEPRYPPQTTSAHHFSAGDENIWTPIEAKKSLVRYHPSYQPISWLFLEAETSIRASLDLAEETQKASNFASSRIDLSLLCPDSKSHDQLDFFVTTLASAVGADVIRIDANDIEELMADYVGQGRDEPGSLSSLAYDVYDGYEADNSETNVKGFGPPEDDEVDEEVEYDESEDDNEDLRPGQGPDGFATLEDLRKALYEKRHELGQALQRIGVTGIAIGSPRIIRIGGAEDPNQSSLLQPSYRSSVSADMARWDDQRLDILLDSMLEAANKKRNAIGPTLTLARTTIQKDLKELIPWQVFRSWQQHPNRFQAQTADLLMYYLTLNVGHEEVVRLEVKGGDSNIPPADFHMSKPKTIVHIRDLKDITRSRLGDVVIRRLVHLIQKRRWRGESIVIVGTTSQANNNIFMTNPPEADDFPFRTITIPPFFKHPASEFEKLAINTAFTNCSTMASPASHRILEINLRHIQNMLRRMRPGYDVDLLATSSRAQMSMQGTQILGEKVLSFDQVQRLVLIAIGLGQTHMKSKVIQPIHFALATYIMTRVDYVTQAWVADQNTYGMRKSVNPGSKGKDGSKADENDPSHSKIASIRADCNQHESRLLTGVVDAQNIKTGFADVHAAEETIDALKTLTTLSLMRPDAFKYGVLANDRLPGLLLYGPPGTGKTLLAKAVAKESKATVLEVSGAQIYEKYVGEGEKMVRAVFSLAKKLSPCIVFIDEADAIFGSRSSAGNRNTHREIINQFLREWDGMNDHSVFMMVASNRPFDLDDAVLRRLPRRLLVDLPVAKDREAILKIHLKAEALDDSVDLSKLAEQTSFYSGSDLKNLCVAAALACVREENELIASHKGDEDFKLPERRTLTSKHFDKAIQEISASISEDMSSLTAIRKFDERYGDRRGRRKKAGYGFGAADAVIDENAARVRQSQPPPPPP